MIEVFWEREPEPEFNILPCNFLWRDRIVGGQGEELGMFKISNVEVTENDVAEVSVAIFENKIKAYEAVIQVVLIGESNLRVNSIEVKWVKYN